MFASLAKKFGRVLHANEIMQEQIKKLQGENTENAISMVPKDFDKYVFENKIEFGYIVFTVEAWYENEFNRLNALKIAKGKTFESFVEDLENVVAHGTRL